MPGTVGGAGSPAFAAHLLLGDTSIKDEETEPQGSHRSVQSPYLAPQTLCGSLQAPLSGHWARTSPSLLRVLGKASTSVGPPKCPGDGCSEPPSPRSEGFSVPDSAPASRCPRSHIVGHPPPRPEAGALPETVCRAAWWGRGTADGQLCTRLAPPLPGVLEGFIRAVLTLTLTEPRYEICGTFQSLVFFCTPGLFCP